MKIKHIQSQIVLLLITTMLGLNLFSATVYAESLPALAIYAGEAMAIQGSVVSYNRACVDTTSLNSVEEIKTAGDLKELADHAALDSYTKDRTFVLTNDIDVTGYEFTCIPSFSGVFEGNGHTITGLTYGGDGYATGLFRYINRQASVQNLTVNARIKSTGEEQITGGICAINEGIISNCTFEGSLQGRDITGGIAAINEVPGTIMACTNKAAITGYYYTGGVTGKNYGVTAYSYNYGNINSTKEWVEGVDLMNPGSDIATDLIVYGTDPSNPLKNDTEEKVATNTGLDTGGISGYSKGAIYQCKNDATIGYEHTGYNVGGIAGRQAGFISFCRNNGMVYGRKDIGGIVGQMEPHLTLSDLETLPQAVDKLHELVNTSLTDIGDSSATASDDMRLLSSYAEDAVTNGDTMMTSATNYLNSATTTANALKAKVTYLSEKMPQFFDYMSGVGSGLSATSSSVTQLLNDLNVYSKLSANEIVSLNQAIATISSNRSGELPSIVIKLPGYDDVEEVDSSVSDDDIEQIISDLIDSISAEDESVSSNDTSSYDISISLSSNGGGILETVSAGQVIVSTLAPHVAESVKSVSGNVSSIGNNSQQAVSQFKEGMVYTNDVIKHINGMDNPDLPYLGSDFDASKELLSQNLKGMADAISSLADHSDVSSEKLTNDFTAVNDQINVVFHIISDQLDRLGNITKGASDEIISDVSEEDIESIEEGRVDHCSNTGEINGDINIGGIAGSMAIDSDDQEETAAGTMDGGFDAKYLLRNIILSCNNNSTVASKKNGVGGIVGYMDHGIVVRCQSYGSVKSSEGEYVGGIAGQSNSIIKESYSMDYLEGNSFIGGIAGFGTTINNCVSIPSFDKDSTRVGSIAGHISTEEDSHSLNLDSVSGNYFVSDTTEGINGLSYAGHAEPTTYKALSSRSDIPTDFGNIPVVYKVEDYTVKQQTLPYGSSMSELSDPVLPPYNGMYVKWDSYDKNSSLTSPTVIKGNLLMIEKTLTSEEKYPGTDYPAALVSGNFIDTDRLNVSISENDASVTYQVTYTTDHIGPIQAVRLYVPYDKAALYGISDGGIEHLISEKKRGSYLEDSEGLHYNTYVVKNTSLLDKLRKKIGI